MKVSFSIFTITFVCLSVITQPVIGAEVYRWIDENGNVHYSDRPNSDDAEQIPILNGQSEVDNSRLRKRQRLLDVMEEERQEKNKAREDMLATAAERKQKCDQVTKRLQQFQESSFLYQDTDDPLNPRILSAEEKNSAIESTRREVQKWCGTSN